MTAPAVDILKEINSDLFDYSLNIFKPYYRRLTSSYPKHLETNYRSSMMSLDLTPGSPLYLVYLETTGCSFSGKVALAVSIEAAIDTAISIKRDNAISVNDLSYEIVSKSVKNINNALYNYALSVKLVGAISVTGFIACFDGKTVSWSAAGNVEGFLGRKNTAFKLAGEDEKTIEQSAFGISSNYKHFVTTIGVQKGDMFLFPKYHEGLSLQLDII